MFDFSFTTFIAPKVLKVFYGIFLVVLALATAGGVIFSIYSMVAVSFISGLISLLVVPIGAFLYLISGRIYFEMAILFFKIYDTLVAIKDNTAK